MFTVINDLKKKWKRADIDSIHKEIIKTITFKDTIKDDLQDRINILFINEKLINKISRNLNPYSVNEANTNTKYGTNQVLSSNSYFANSNNDSTSDSSITPQTPLKGSETPSTKSIPDLTIGLLTPTKKTIENAETNFSEKNIDTMTRYDKIKVESFKENILQNLWNNIKEILDSEFTIFKSKWEELVEISSVRYNKQIDHLKNELQMKDKIIDQLLKSLSSLTNCELDSKNNIIQKLLDQTNDEKKKKWIPRQNDINTKSDIGDNKSDEKDSFNSTKKETRWKKQSK